MSDFEKYPYPYEDIQARVNNAAFECAIFEVASKRKVPIEKVRDEVNKYRKGAAITRLVSDVYRLIYGIRNFSIKTEDLSE